MKTLVVGLDCAAPEVLFGEPGLDNLRRLMEMGTWGRMESVVPPITVPAWMCMSTSRDPGSLGVYGFRNRRDHGYGPMGIVSSRDVRAPAIWDQVSMEGGSSVIVGVPPSYPPRKLSGVCVGGFMTPETAKGVFTHPASVSDEIRSLVGDYPVDVPGFRTDDKAWLRDQIHETTRRHFEVVRHLMRTRDWDHFQFVEIGLDRIQHGFWKHHDPAHPRHDPESPWRDVVRDYYRLLDEEVGSLLELLDEETAVLVVSDHGARALEGGFCVNEWMIREGLLSLRSTPDAPTRFDDLDVDWGRTTAWGAGGYYARVCLNVRGREPEGTIDPADYERVRADLKARLEATEGPDGRPLGTRVVTPEEAYAEVRGIAPDLIVLFGDLAWRSVGRVGYGQVHVQENDTGPDDCNHAQFGAFILAAPGLPAAGETEGAHLLDVAPTLLELGGRDVPDGMQGRSLLGGIASAAEPAFAADGEALVRERLSGLGYLG